MTPNVCSGSNVAVLPVDRADLLVGLPLRANLLAHWYFTSETSGKPIRIRPFSGWQSQVAVGTNEIPYRVNL